MKNNEYIELIEKGDRISQNILYKETNDFLTSYARSIYRYNESIINDTLSKIFINLSLYDKEISNYNTWCITILKNEINNNIRRYTCQKRDYKKEVNIDDKDIFIQLHQEEYDDELNSYFSLMEKTIKENNMIELSMFIYDNLKQQQIADILDLNINTIKSRIDQQKKKLKKILK